MEISSQTIIKEGAMSPFHTLNLEVGSVRCAFRCRDTEAYTKLKRLYRKFLTRPPADITVELEGTDRLSQDDLSAAVPETKYFHENNCFRSTSQIVAGQYDLEHRFIRITGERRLANPDLPLNHLNQLFSLAYYSACKVKYGGNPPAMLVHACAILRSGQVLIFTGPSEAGKTTIARLCGKRDGEVINDEMLLVSRPDRDGNGISVRSAPILGRFPPRRNVTAPLRCIFLIKKGSKTSVRCIDKSEAYLKFMRQIITPAYIGQRDKRAILSLMADFSDQVTRAIPVYELEFNLDGESLWRVVGELEGQLARKERP
jgi:hypothetical protein